MTECQNCHGVGLVRVQDAANNWVSRACECQASARLEAGLRRADFPDSYGAATFESFKALPHVKTAITMTKAFVKEYTPVGNGNGLLLTGSVGTGKTHLAVAAGRALIERYNARVTFVDVRDLLQRLRQSYGSDNNETERAILKPVLEADVAILDELGAVRPTDWVFEMTEAVIGRLYNAGSRVVVTTNFANLGPGQSTSNGYERAARAETLGDRIGARMWSRLQQMCVTVDVNGPDYRARKA